MTKQFSTLIFSAITLSYLSGCGGDGEDPSVPKSVIGGITDGYTITRGAELTLDGLASTDDVKIINYIWMIDDKVVSNSVTDKLLVKIPVGKHKVCLTTEDADKKSNMVCKNINVVEQKIKIPTAIVNNIPKSGWKTKSKITISGKESTANFERTIKSYKWLKDGIEIGSDVNQTFKFETAGKHNITLEVTDNMGEKGTITKSVNIEQIGKPTVKLTLFNRENKLVFSGESKIDKTWQRSADDKNLPHKSNFLFMSATGSYDDDNLTDDNLTFLWKASIYDDTGYNHAPGGIGCFYNKGELRDEPMRFDGTLFNIVSMSTVTKNDGTFKYPDVEVVNGNYNGWNGWSGWQEEKWEHVFLSMCPASLPYNHLRITLTVKDNTHGTETTVIKYLTTPL